MANPRVAWGIDIGNRALKAVKLVRTGNGVKIDDVDIIEHEHILSNAGDNRDQLIQTALAVFTSKHQLKGANAAIGVSGQQSFARFIKLPPVEDRKIPEIVRFEAIQQIPFPLDEVEWAYQLFRQEGNPDVEVGIFAMKKDLVNQHLANFTSAGLNVQAVQMTPLADYNALAYDDKIKGATMIIDLGAENADLIIAEGDAVWMRSIPIGGNHFTEALVRDFKLRFERAEELKRTTATSPHGRRILQAMRPVFADLVSEIQRSIGFYSSTHRDSRISRVIALGGTFKLPGLQKYLQQNLSLEVVKLDSLGQNPPTDAKVAATLNENILSAVSAYGLALQALGEAKINSSLLPQSIQRERFWHAKTKWFGAAAACFVVGTALAFVGAQQQENNFDSPDARQARREVDQTLSDGKRLDQAWATVQSAGADERKKITEVKTLAEYRDVWPVLYTQIYDSIPQPKAVKERADSKDAPKPKTPAPKSAAPATKPGAKPATGPGTDAATLQKFGARASRNEATLEDLEVVYAPHIGDYVYRNPDGTWFKNNDDFNNHKGNRDPAVYLGVRGRHGAAAGAATPGVVGGIGDGVGGPAVPMAPPMPSPSMTPSNPSDPGQASQGIPDKRGYWLTLHLVTPNNANGKGGSAFIENTVVAKLLELEQKRIESFFTPEEIQEILKDWNSKPQDAQLLGPQGKLEKFIAAYANAVNQHKKPPRALTFSIARIGLPSSVQIRDDDVRKNALIERARASIDRKLKTAAQQGATPGAAPGTAAPGTPGAVPTPAAPPPPPQPGVNGPGVGAPGDVAQPFVQPGFTPQPGLTPDASSISKEELEKLLIDPNTKESVQEDYVVTVLVAVVLDPLPENKTPQPAATEGDQPPPES
jgi:type IV pilus assembly protein PilM